tara:strand:+ start:223 stop:420 length:198 start_codon:yes stop_codon:yes gene_type:complete
MDKTTQPLNWHELHRYDELPDHTKEALLLLINTLASHREEDKIQWASKESLDRLRIKIAMFEDWL